METKSPAVVDLPFLDFAANCSIARSWLQSSWEGPVNPSNSHINIQYMRSVLPPPFDSRPDSAILDLYDELAGSLSPLRDKWYINATGSIWKECCDFSELLPIGLLDFGSLHDHNAVIASPSCMAEPFDVTLFNFSRDCALTAQWSALAKNPGSDVVKGLQDYETIWTHLSVKLFQSAWPQTYHSLTDAQVAMWFNLLNDMDVAILSDVVFSSTLGGSCTPKMCKMQSLTGGHWGKS